MRSLKKTKISDIPVVILCGGKGARISSLTQKIPKPLIEVGDRPILWHVMKIYASWGVRRFILCLGYKSRDIEEYFRKHNREKWDIRFVNTGLDTLKSRRLAQVRPLIKGDIFFLAYGDDVTDINLKKLLKLHETRGLIATITVVRVVSDFGIVKIGNKNIITDFQEKPQLNKWMNGGFMVMRKEIFGYLDSGELEGDVFRRLAREKKIAAYRHKGKWLAMNTLKDCLELNALWDCGKAFWKIW